MLVTLMLLMASSATAQEFSSDTLTYKIVGSVAWVTGLTSRAKTLSNLALHIPGAVTYNGTSYRVWGIVNGNNQNSFKNCTNITYVSICYGLSTIEANAFQGCTKITTLSLPSSLRSVSAGAFSGCTALTDVYYAGFDYPTGTMSSTSFPSNTGMKLYISTQSKRTPTEYKTQYGFTQFATVEKSIYAFDVYVDDGGMYAIGYPDNDGPSVVRRGTLVGFTGLKTVYKPTSASYSDGGISFTIDTIGVNAFQELQGQTSLTTIDLTKCDNLRYFKGQDENTRVQNVTKLVLPKSNFSFIASTFSGFTSLAAFELASGSTKYSIFDGCLYNYSKDRLYCVPPGKSGAMSYPNTLKVVGDYSHYKCTKITSARLPYGVVSIWGDAFLEATSLGYVFIPSSVTYLANGRTFLGTKENLNIYCNMANPPTVTIANFLYDTSKMRLYVPYGKIDTYKSAGWTGFHDYNYNDEQAHDIYTGGLGYTVTSTASTTVNGKSYDGRAKLVCYGLSNNDAGTNISIPEYITCNGKTYAVTKIGEEALNNHTSNFTVSGCVNIDTIGDYAFQNQPITKYPFTHNLKCIMRYAFDGAGLTGNIVLPYGISYLGARAFGNGKYSRLIVPSSLISISTTFCTGTSTLTELVLNLKTSTYYWTGWNLTGVPANCYIRVPTGVVNQYKQNSAFSSRASYITAGAYDFAKYNSLTDRYFLTITSTSPVTYNGTTYAGKAKYVYHPNVENVTSYTFNTYEEDRSAYNSSPKYLITEIGDSCLTGAKTTSLSIPATVTRIGDNAFYGVSTITTNNLTLPEGLTYIGANAFRGTKLTGEIKIPTTVTNIQHDAFWYVPLTALYFPGNKPNILGTDAWYSGSNASNLTVWVPNQYANNYLNAASASGWQVGGKNRLAVWIKPDAETQMFSSVVPTNLQGSNVRAYYASNYDKSQTGKELTLTQINQAPANTGLLLADLTAGTEYRIKRPTTTASAPANNYLIGNPTASQDVNAVSVGYYWDGSAETPHFVKPTANVYLAVGSAYLKLSSAEAGTLTEVYTDRWPKNVGNPYDVNGDGNVDVSDLNTLVDVILGISSLADFPAADIDGNGDANISDLNMLIDYLLGQ